jgi:uncharacterized protein YjbI with pentapeptide repeats
VGLAAIPKCGELLRQQVWLGLLSDLAKLRTNRLSPRAIPMKIENADLSASEFINSNLGKAQFRDVRLAEAQFVDVNLSGARFEDVSLTGVSIRNANCSHMTLEDACYEDMRIEGILVSDLLRVYREQDTGPSVTHQEEGRS